MQSILEVNHAYWWWPSDVQRHYFESSVCLTSNLDQNSIILPLSTFVNQTEKCIKTRKRRNVAIDIDQKVQDVYLWIKDKSLQFIQGCAQNRTLHDTLKGRGSHYVGVSKNGSNWQVLINQGNQKKYIGTFSCEKEAAINYDFYSICLHMSKAKTNFTYNSDLILELMKCYNQRNKKFNGLGFMDYV